MIKMHMVFANRPGNSDSTINFFYGMAKPDVTACLACPFFTDTKPVDLLKEARASKIKLLVRLCEATSVEALKHVQALDGVDVRYFTDRAFHAKFYIIDDMALVGSANITNAGMMKNREVSVVIDADDPRFEELPGIFDELWSNADVLTADAIGKFAIWRKKNFVADPSPIEGITDVGPSTVNVASQNISKERSMLHGFRVRYDEEILPQHRKIERAYFSTKERHPDFQEFSKAYELDRFMYWAADEYRTADLHTAPLRSDSELTTQVITRKLEFLKIVPDSVYHNVDEIRSLEHLAKLAKEPGKIAEKDIDELIRHMSACNAFRARHRFTSGGIEPLLRNFKKRNTPQQIEHYFNTMLHGSGDYAQRLYDCIYDPSVRLREWGRNSTLEIFGWINSEGIPPVNGRTTKAIRVLGLETPLI